MNFSIWYTLLLSLSHPHMKIFGYFHSRPNSIGETNIHFLPLFVSIWKSFVLIWCPYNDLFLVLDCRFRCIKCLINLLVIRKSISNIKTGRITFSGGLLKRRNRLKCSKIWSPFMYIDLLRTPLVCECERLQPNCVLVSVQQRSIKVQNE